MNAAYRIKRGFARLGIVCGVLATLAGVGFAFLLGSEAANNEQIKFEQMKCIRAKIAGSKEFAQLPDAHKYEIDVRTTGCLGPRSFETYSNVIYFDASIAPSWIGNFAPKGLGGLFLAALVGALVFGAIYTIGWTLAGFAKGI